MKPLYRLLLRASGLGQTLTVAELVVGALAMMLASPARADQAPVKVFILAGQSNMEGYGGIRTLDELGTHPTASVLLRRIRKADGSFVARDDVFLYYHRDDQTIRGPLTVGQGAGPDRIGPELMFGMVITPMIFFGCTYYPWNALDKFPILKWAVLVNPLVYASEGMRAMLVPGFPHLSIVAVLAALVFFDVLLLALGLRQFEKKAIS